MPKSHFDTKEGSILQAYKISSLYPTKWEEIDYQLENQFPRALSNTGSSADDPLGLRKTISVHDMDVESKAALLMTSKSFDPKAFLTAVHPNAKYQDFSRGILYLKHWIDAHSEAMRRLVEDNFNRFVAVKSSTDAIYSEMQEGLLAPSTQYASKPLRDHLKRTLSPSDAKFRLTTALVAAANADKAFIPILENASKAHKLRTTLGIFERSKFFFNLPGFIIQSIEAGRYEIAVRDYKKGKTILETRPGQLLPIGKDDQGSAEADQRQKRILNKVWGSVERAMGEMRHVLVSQLQDPRRSVEQQEKTLELLLDIQMNEDPVWTYLDSQHNHIIKQLHISTTAVSSIRVTLDSDTRKQENLTSILVAQLQAAIAALENKESGAVIAKCAAEPAWIAILALVKKLSEIVLSSLRSFWRISKSFMDGKYKRSTECRRMATDIVKLYISLLSQFFRLSDMAVMTSPGGSNSPPPSLPTNSNSLCTSYHLLKILGEVQETVTELNEMEISSEAASGLKGLLETTTWRFEDVLAASWLRDANIFYYLEKWIPSALDASATHHLTQMELFQRHVTTAAFKIATVDIGRPGRQNLIPAAFVSKITRAFLDALYGFLDGLVHLASEESRLEALESLGKVDAPEALDLRDGDTRVLLVISNFGHVARSMIPSVIAQLESAFGISISEDRQTLMTVVQELDRTLFEGSIKPKADYLTAIIRGGIMDPAVDWYDTPQPTEIRPYVHEALVYLVTTHAHISAISKGLVERTLTTLVDALTVEAFQCLTEVPRFGVGGLMRARLEINFIQQALGRYVSPSAARQLQDLYSATLKAYVQRPSDEELRRSLNAVETVLEDMSRATQLEFLCFQSNKIAGGDNNGATRAQRLRSESRD
ncbi:exocyst complex component sec5 [Mycena metata]|uniref:Exocyst complex component SEC5 n=1 Tax=Mycena metata TaxID=1033252 RepID=A0AAD7K0A3_9AGAR|nr:exocyst complex component sec5 [Mycena metata]